MRYLAFVLIFIYSFSSYSNEKGSLKAYFFNGTQIVSGVKVRLVSLKDSNNIIEKFSDKYGEVEINAEPGEYHLDFLFKDKITRSKNLKIFAANETQLIISFEDYKYNVALDLPKNFIKDKTKKNLKIIKSDLNLVLISGRVLDSDKRPIANANILSEHIESSILTDKKGYFQFKVPSAENVEISVVHPNYSSGTQIIDSAERKLINFELIPATVALDKLVVLAPHVKGSLSSMMTERKNSLEVKDYLGSEQIAKSGDSSAASALKRVTGLSLVDGKFIYVRGLGERYSSTSLNGSLLPSPDPSRKVVPMDMFPSTIIESIEVQKTYSSDQLAEFGGGLVGIRTRSIPDKFFSKMSASVGISDSDVLSGQEQGIFHSNSSSDWTGYDREGARALPQLIKQALAEGKELNSISDPDDPFSSTGENSITIQEQELLGESFNNNYSVEEKALPPNFGLSFEIGDSVKRGKILKFGGSAKLSYKNDIDTDLRNRKAVDVVSSSSSVITREDNSVQTENIINLGGVVGLGLEVYDRHFFDFTNVISRSTTNSTETIEKDTKNDIDDFANIYRLKWQEREVNSQQFKGKHLITERKNGPQLNWSLTRSKATLDEPDFREYYYLKTPNGFEFADDKVYGNSRSFSQLEEVINDLKLSFNTEKKFISSETSHMNVALNIGYQRLAKNRDFDVRRFRFRNDSTASNNLDFDRQAGLDGILSKENIKSDGFRLIDSTLATDNYAANQNVNAFYMQASNTFSFKYNTKKGSDYFKPQIVYGIRFETSDQQVRTFDLHSKNEPVLTSLETNDILPSIGLNLGINKNNNLRFGFTKTVSRPDFKELSPSRFLNDDENIFETGNPDLVSASITNFDIRWEWFPTNKELISVGFFTKNFLNPIEAYAVNSTDDIRSYRNIKSAFNSGLEFEIRKDVSAYTGPFFNTEIFTNYSLITSEVNLSEQEKGNSTNSERPLQGQSPYLFNFGVDFAFPRQDINATFVFNVAGERITDVGDSGRDDIYEQPVQQLDFSLNKKIREDLSLSFKARNILDPEVKRTQGAYTVSSFNRGRAFSLSVSSVF